MEATQPEPQSLSEALDADMFKVVADRIVQESGITPILHCFAVDAIMDGSIIKGVITESKSGRQAILAKRVIDATGDADIVHHAGAPYRKASKEELLGVTVTLLRTFGSSLGIRESRKIIGTYNITEHDVRNEARFEDAIGIFPEFLDAYGVVIIPTTGRYFQVPYGIILPQKVENLLVAGRCVAGDKISHAATRQMMCCTVTGQGAGVAAAVSLKQHVTCRQVDISQVQKSLQRQGVRIA